jgi:hypothetical protein
VADCGQPLTIDEVQPFISPCQPKSRSHRLWLHKRFPFPTLWKQPGRADGRLALTPTPERCVWLSFEEFFAEVHPSSLKSRPDNHICGDVLCISVGGGNRQEHSFCKRASEIAQRLAQLEAESFGYGVSTEGKSPAKLRQQNLAIHIAIRPDQSKRDGCGQHLALCGRDSGRVGTKEIETVLIGWSRRSTIAARTFGS